jgi:hypothetical protein
VVVDQLLLADQVGVGLVSRQTREVPGILLQQRQAKGILVAVVTEVLPLVTQEAVVVAQVELVVTEQVRRVVLVAQVVHRRLQDQALLAQAGVVVDQEMVLDLVVLPVQVVVGQVEVLLPRMVVLVQQTLVVAAGLVDTLPQILQMVATAVPV